jgi:hypothetical protein
MIASCNILGGQHEVKPEAQLLQIAVNPNARLEAATWRVNIRPSHSSLVWVQLQQLLVLLDSIQ